MEVKDAVALWREDNSKGGMVENLIDDHHFMIETLKK
jgi:hypothetical protein